MKPQLADDAVLEDLRYPLIAQPKFDGVRSLNLRGTLTGRSLDPFAGFGVTEFFSRRDFKGFDGEMVLGSNPLSTDRLCNQTAGAMGRFKGVTQMADLHWWIFDDLTDPFEPYQERYDRASRRVEKLCHPRVHLVPMDWINDRRSLNQLIEVHLDNGAEGTIVRNPQAGVKEGRPTKKGQELLRIKLWSEAEIVVHSIIEGESNQNEAVRNTLGKSERSSAKAGKVPNGQVGSIRGPLLKDILHPLTRKLLLPRGTLVTVGPGEMTTAEATLWFRQPEKLMNHIVTFKFMPHGMKDAPRMPTFKSKRLPQDWDQS